jgi:hypothetical protein
VTAPVVAEASSPSAGARVHAIDAGTLAAPAAFVLVAGLAAAQGGYFPSSWGWGSVGASWAVALAILAGRPLPRGRAALFLAALAALTAWTAISAVWSGSTTATALEVQRDLLYVVAAGSALTLLARDRYAPVLAAVFAAVVAVSTYSLASRLFPDRVGVFDPTAGNRLSEPIGYWNALGLFMAMGIVLGIGLSGAKRPAARAATAAAMPVLVTTLYFTFGRAAWVALGVGIAVLVTVSPTRLQLLARIATLAAGPVVCVLYASRSEALVALEADFASAADDGRRLAAVVLLAAAAAAALALVLHRLEQHIVLTRRARVAVGTALAVAAVTLAGTLIVERGGPVRLVQNAYDEFRAPPPKIENLNERYRSFSGNGRADLWGIAWDNYREAGAAGGSGGGTYERFFLAHSPPGLGKVRDAHGLYVEVLSELGAVGLAILVFALAVPLVVGLGARRQPFVPAALGAYAAFLVQAGVDWIWEVPAVTVAAFVVAAAVLAAGTRSMQRVDGRARVAAVTAALALGTIATYGLLGESAIASSADDVSAGATGKAVDRAEQAAALMPWSARSWLALGDARAAAGDRGGAKAAFVRAASEDPGDWLTWYGVARTSRGADARAAVARASALAPHDAAVQTLRSQILEAGR